EADGATLQRVVRDQIGKGADWIKVYADAWNPDKGGTPTFTEDELRLMVETAKSAGRPVVAHAMTKEGMRRSAAAAVGTIRHRDNGGVGVVRYMAKKKRGPCPHLAAPGAGN